jgi:hypothetical protein
VSETEGWLAFISSNLPLVSMSKQKTGRFGDHLFLPPRRQVAPTEPRERVQIKKQRHIWWPLYQCSLPTRTTPYTLVIVRGNSGRKKLFNS